MATLILTKTRSIALFSSTSEAVDAVPFAAGFGPRDCATGA
jgi:hypothetical protein